MKEKRSQLSRREFLRRVGAFGVSTIFIPPSGDPFYTEKRKKSLHNLLDDDYPYPLGGMKHSELVTESCLAVAELRANDERGIHWESFIHQLAAAIAQDRKHGAQYFPQY